MDHLRETVGIMTESAENRYLRALGRRLLSEANDLKRTPEVLASV